MRTLIPPRRFTEAQRQQILAYYAAGEKVEWIAEIFSCTKQYPGKLAKERGLVCRTKGKRPEFARMQA